VQRAFIPGLELSRLFYEEMVEPLLRDLLDGTSYSAGLIGYGSEVQGFDSARSTDHAWGPRIQVFLSSAEFRMRGDSLDALLAQRLPAEFRGYPVRFAFPDNTPKRHWVHVVDVDDCFESFLGAVPDDLMPVPLWLSMPTQVLRELTGGLVFHDGLDVLERRRRALAWYPTDVWKYVLACQWMRLSQEEAFIGRCGEVGDELGSAVVAARQVRDLMRLCLLIDQVYPPYSKWLGTAFTTLPCSAELSPLLSAAMAATDWQERERWLSLAYEHVAGLQNDLGLTAEVDPHVRPYFTRPFQVLRAERFAEALLSSISNDTLEQLPPVGAIDQYVDNAELTDRVYLARRRQYLR